ncbi:cytochrome p450 [Rhizoctonia solani]|uniref:Cytochrome p450 n=1 Tax=Rhizoctonia solani TaxID=456999 RepID=A0A8H7LZ20_9AGAM|nr:cytochrome p450 [Rhizoctonia solani]
MIRDCISSETLYNEIFTALSGTLLRSIYGYSIGGKDDPLLEQAMEFVQNLCEAAIPGNFLVNTFPSLRYIPSWFPGARWKQVAREWREQKNKTLNDFYSKTKEKIALGNHEQSIIASSLSEAKALGLSSEEADDYLSHIGITLYLGGTDTTCNVILVFFIAMIHFPATQQKAQAEIDEVIGDSRLPEMEDMHQLPYTNCLIQEVLRWCPIVPLGVPHAASKDDFYRGFYIPKGATVIGNIWAMSRDKRFYKDPEEFNPDRFSDPLVPPCPAFGFGRRECPGIHFAESSLFSIIASILASFNIKGPENIKSSAPELVSTNDFVFHPKEFEVLMEPRSVKHAHLICSEI